MPFPSSTGEVKLGATDFKELEKANTFLKEHTLIVKKYSGSATLVTGELALQESTGKTFTLPSATTANQYIGIQNGVAELKVTTSGGAVIFGDFVAGEATIVLLQRQHVILQSDGTNWQIIAGEPKREQSWGAEVTRTSGTEYEPSATRPTQVIFTARAAQAFAVELFEGSTKIAVMDQSGSASQVASITFQVNPGKKWKFVANVGPVEGVSNYLLL